MSYFTVAEFQRSNIADEYGIDNTIPDELLENIAKLMHVLTPIREYFDSPIVISSGYRCPILNKHRKIRGSKYSKHLYGLAADFRVKGVSVEDSFGQIIENFEASHYRTLIQEKNRWLHLDIGDQGARNFRYAGKTYVVDDRYIQKKKAKTCFCF